MKISISLIALSLTLFITSTIAANKLVYLSQLTNEGARSNVGPNPIPAKEWEFGAGELTSMGLRQHYLVGSDLKLNYAGKLKLQSTYSPYNIYIRSTNHNFTLMGAQSELEALYPPDVRKDLTEAQAKLAVPPGDNSIISEEITALGNKIMPNNFQTVPIHSVNLNNDSVLGHRWCSKIHELTTQSLNDTKWETQINEKYKGALDAFRTYMKKDNMTIHQIYPYLDGLHALKFNLTSIDELEAQYTSLMSFRFEYMDKQWSNADALTLYSNGYITEMIRYLNDSINQYENVKLSDYFRFKMNLYFGTSESIYVISKHLGRPHDKYPDFSNQMLVQLEQDEDKKYWVTIFYNKYPFGIGGECKNAYTCELSNFLKFIETKKASSNALKECKPLSESGLMMIELEPQSVNYLLIGGIWITAIILISLLIICVLRGRKIRKSVLIHVEDPESLLIE